MPDPILKTHAAQAAHHFERAAASLALRQTAEGKWRGNVAPWPGCADADFHGTLAAIWVWARHQGLSADSRFSANREAGWTFVESLWRQFIPEAIGSDASDEAAYDCAMVLRAAVAERAVPGAPPQRADLVAGAARVLAAYLADLDDLSGRDFQDPGFLAWNLVDYARSVEDRGLLSAGRRFVERAFGMKAPPAFASEPELAGRLFDFSSTTATRVLAIVASEGNTPFVGAWLRERVVASIPGGFSSRARDENCWNACAAVLLGRAYVVSTDPMFLETYRQICGELARRDERAQGGGGMGREGDRGVGGPDTLATFYYALATDALLRADASDITSKNSSHAK
ncbi:MAG: hypothetical protein ABUL77_05420 [Bacteroidota bacterium]